MPNRYAQKVEELKGESLSLMRGREPIHLSEKQLQEIERELNASLPEDYAEFIRDYGDYFFSNNTRFPVEPNSRGKSSGALEEVYAAIPSRGSREYSLVDRYRDFCEHVDKWPPNWLPIGAAGRDDCIALSIAGEDKGTVYLIVEYLWETGEGSFRVANSFDEFIQLLYNVDEDED